MKKFISLFVVVCTLLSLAVCPAAAAENVYYSKPAISVTGGNTATAETGTIYGLAEGTGYYGFTPRTDKNYYCTLQYKQSDFPTDESYKYIVFEADFAPEDSLKEISLYTAGTTQASYPLTASWNTNRWNSLRVVYERPTTAYTKGRTVYYLNGRKVKEFSANKSTFAQNDYRLCFTCEMAQPGVKIKNYRMYFTEINPSLNALPAEITDRELLGNVYMASGAVETEKLELKAMLTEGKTLNDIAVTDGAAKRAYTDNTFQTEVEADAALSNGNVIVVEKNSVLTYYDVIISDKIEIYGEGNQPEFRLNNIEKTGKVLSGIGGKAEERTLNQYAVTDGKTAASLAFSYPLTYHYRYVTAKYNIYVDDASTIRATATTTSGGTASSWFRGDNIRSGAWMNVTVVHDTLEGKNKTYFDGNLYQNWKATDGQFLANINKKEFRIALGENAENGGTRTFLIDNFELFTTPNEPEQGGNFKSISAPNAYGRSLFYKKGITAEELVAEYPIEDATVTVFDQSTGEAAAESIPENAALAIASDGEKSIRTYKLVALKENELATYGSGISDGKTAAGNITVIAFPSADAKMICAKYNGGVLSGIEFGVLSGSVLNKTITVSGEEGETVKFMVWENDTFKPLTGYISFSAPEADSQD